MKSNICEDLLPTGGSFQPYITCLFQTSRDHLERFTNSLCRLGDAVVESGIVKISNLSSGLMACHSDQVCNKKAPLL